MIKVLHVIGRFGSGGDSKIITDIKERIENENIRFDFLTFEIKENEITEKVRKSKSNIFIIEQGDLRKCGIKKYITNLNQFFKEHKDYDFVHIHVGMQSGLVSYACKKNNINQVIVHAHTTTLQRRTNIIKKFLVIPIFRKLINLFSDKRVACGIDSGKFLFGNKAKFEVIHNGIDISAYGQTVKNNIKKELNISDNDTIITQVGSFQYMKNQEFSIKMMEYLEKNYNLLLVGANNNEYKIETLEKNVLQLGRRNDVVDILNKTDFFIMPSRKGEGLPISLIEAQIAGCRCLVSDNITKEADLGLGLVSFLPIDNAKIWADNIKENRNNNINLTFSERIERVKKMGFDIETSVNRWRKLYER